MSNNFNPAQHVTAGGAGNANAGCESATNSTIATDFQEKVECCAVEIVRTKPQSVQAISMLLTMMLPPAKNIKGKYDLRPLRYYVAIYRRVMEIDPANVAKDMIGGTPTLSNVEVDAYARRLIRARNRHEAMSAVGHLGNPDRAVVLARQQEISEGFEANGVVPFKLTELS